MSRKSQKLEDDKHLNDICDLLEKNAKSDAEEGEYPADEHICSVAAKLIRHAYLNHDELGQYVSICKNVIASNNKREWRDPDPAIRISDTPSGKVVERAHTLGIKDSEGNLVAQIISTTDGKPVIKCGAKVALVTTYPTVRIK